MKENKSTNVNITERNVEDDISLSLDWNKKCLFPGSISRSDDEDTELVSVISSLAGSGWRKSRASHVVGENDSVFSMKSNCGADRHYMQKCHFNQPNDTGGNK